MAHEILIELTDEQLLAVSGGDGTAIIAQGITQSAAILQSGGDVRSVFGDITSTQSFTASITQTAANVNSGTVTVS